MKKKIYMIEWYNIAQDMLGYTRDEQLPESLYSRLEHVHHLAEMAGGGLHSRQCIATIVEQWLRDLPNE